MKKKKISILLIRVKTCIKCKTIKIEYCLIRMKVHVNNFCPEKSFVNINLLLFLEITTHVKKIHGASYNFEQCSRVLKKIMEYNVYINHFLAADKKF